jgi:hypothetical protein
VELTFEFEGATPPFEIQLVVVEIVRLNFGFEGETPPFEIPLVLVEIAKLMFEFEGATLSCPTQWLMRVSYRPGSQNWKVGRSMTAWL